MAGGPLNAVLRYIRRSVPAPPSDVNDGELLERFVSRRDERAFATLTERHGSLVLGVCRRVLNDVHAVEDAYQATFLILVRKARSLAGQESLAGWLYTVAYHTALKVRARAARQRDLEKEAPRMPPAKPLAESTWADLRPVLDEELSRLPEKYRLPMVLCYLEGKTNDEAAAQLGWTRGTIAGRLSRARDLLRDRLVRRGMTLSVGGLTVMLTQGSATAGVPTALAQMTGTAAFLLVSGKGLVEVASVPVVALVEGMIRTFWLAQLKTAASVAVMLAAVGAGAAALIPRAPATVYLADLPEARLNVPAKDYFFHGGTVKGVDSPRNLALHPPTSGYSSVTYKLDRQYRTFQTAVGIRDNPEGGSQQLLTFMVLGDGQLLWKSQPLRLNGKTEECQVSVQGVDLLELQVHCPSFRWYAWAAWVEPKLTR